MSERTERARSFLDAMSAGDGDRAVALAAPEIVVAFGAHEYAGREALRRMAEEEASLVTAVVPDAVDETGCVVVARARRIQRWRETGEIAHEGAVQVTFAFGGGDLIERVDLSPAA